MRVLKAEDFAMKRMRSRRLSRCGKERERLRSEILAAVDKAENSITRGEGRTITRASMRAIAKDVKRRGRLRISRKPNSNIR